ncbi:MAG: chloride channel protein, partial [Acidimicrobiales bacterium]
MNPPEAKGGDTVLSPPSHEQEGEAKPRALSLGDFSVTVGQVWRVFLLSIIVGALAAGVSLGLLDLIGFFTHFFYYGETGVRLVQPSIHRFGALTILIPVFGGLIIGAMAYWGSERIRGHGIPEAMETILVGGSKMEPRLTILKPISSAISIGTGGPFGAEGPIILTGGAVGSVLAQFFRLSAFERRTLLVAGACAGMAAVFGTPVAATLFGVELLVFEFKPRSMVPIGIAVVVADLLRNIMASDHLILSAPLFPVPPHGAFSSIDTISAAAIGVATGLLAVVLTTAVYGAEDLFKKIPIHWAWWPAIGGVIVGVGGLIEPRALGVGYAEINLELAGKLAIGTLILLLIVKLVIWSVALGSGTSGGILAPLMIMGAALGGIMGPVMPGGTKGTWALLGMAGCLAGVTRSPFTSVIFAFELTHDTGSLLPLLLTCCIAHLLSSLILKRSILTEKVARRGFHVVREYQVDPAEALFVREAMGAKLITLVADQPVSGVRMQLAANPEQRRQRIYPVLDDNGEMTGIVTGSDLFTSDGAEGTVVEELQRPVQATAWEDETLRNAAERMAEGWIGALPVVKRDDPNSVVGVITEFDLLKAR